MTAPSNLDDVEVDVTDLGGMAAWCSAALDLTVDFDFTTDAIARWHHARERRRLPAPTSSQAEQLGWPTRRHTRGRCPHTLIVYTALNVDSVDGSYTKPLDPARRRAWQPQSSQEPGIPTAFVADPDGDLIELHRSSTSTTALAAS